jgi:uncharacterized membrane protein
MDRPIFGTATRWALRVLAWLAFAISAYLAWHAAGQTAVAGCEPGSGSGCDAVLNSPWSKWLGIPVAVIGLASYAALAGLSVLLGMEGSSAGRWIKTAFLMFGGVAAGASLWFIGLQFVAIGEFCLYCLITDICGLALGAISIWSVAQWFLSTRDVRRSQSSATGLMALRSALPISAAARSVPVVASSVRSAPALGVAIGGAVLLLLVLVTGQVVFPAMTHSLLPGSLDEPIALAGSNGAISKADAKSTDNGAYVAMRIPSETAPNGDADTSSLNGERTQAGSPQAALPWETADSQSAEPTDASESESSGDKSSSPLPTPPRERIVEFLNGSLRLDVHKHPLIGSPEAPHVMVEMISYDCSHCRQMHRLVKKGLARYGDQLAIVVIPIPLEMSCNRLVTTSAASHSGACTTARMVLGVSAIQPELFGKFHDWLMADKEKPPLQSQVVTKAYNMVDSTQLSKHSRSPALKEQLAEYIDLYAKLQRQQQDGKFGLPVQILGNHIMAGAAANESDVFDAWEKHLGVVRR